MNHIKTYREFLNEGAIGEKIMAAIKWMGSFFKGKGSKFLNAMLAQEKGVLPKGVKIIPTEEDKQLYGEIKGTKDTKPKEEEKETSESISTWGDFFLMSEKLVNLDHPNANVLNVGDKELFKVIDRAYKSKDPLMIWGAPGIGKTSIVNAVTKRYGGRMIEAPLTTMAPEDFFLPAVSGEGISQKAVDLPKEWLPVYHKDLGKEGDNAANGADGKGGILFLDELNRARAEVQDVCLKLVLERKVGQYRLGSAWSVIAAGNREGDDNTSTMSFSKILGNRFTQVNYSPTFDDWKQWANTAKDENDRFIVDPDFIAFMNWAPEWFYKLDNEDDSPVWPSPRSWTKASQQYIQAKEDGADSGEMPTFKELENIVASNVGKVAAGAFMGFVKLKESVDFDKMGLVWTEPDKAPLPPKGASDGYKPDITYAMLAAIAFSKRDVKNRLTKNELENVIKYAIRLKQAAWASRLMAGITEIHKYYKDRNDPDHIVFSEAMNPFVDAYPELRNR